MGRVNIQRQVTGSTTYGMSYGYNVGGLLTSETYNSGRVTNYAYDEGGRLSGVTDGLGAAYDSSYTYAPHGGLSSETFGNSAVHSMTYNNALQASEIKLKQSANGAELQRYNYSYGQVNQATGAVDTTKNNGQIGRVDGTINGAATKEWDQRFTYDELGRLSIAAEFQQGDNNNKTWQFKYTYDRWGNRFQSSNSSENYGVPFTPVVSTDISSSTNRFTSGVTYDNGNPGAGNITSDSKFRGLSYAYDANNRQLSATGTGVSQTSVYDCAGQRVQTTANGVTRTMVYDIFGQDIADYTGTSGGTLEREYIYRGGQLLVTTTSFYLGISNAGFETPALGAGAYQYDPTGAAWTFTGNSGVSSNGSGFTYANPNAPEGNQVAFLQGGSPAAISQSISGFQAGVTYTLTFSAAQRPCCATSQDFQVYLDNTLLGTFHPSGTSYADYSTTFTTTAGAHVLKFAGLNSNGGDNTAFIDKVRIAYAAPSVVSAGNAGFETPALGAGAYQYNPTGASWTFAGNSGVTSNGSGFTWNNPNAPEGNQVAFLQGGSPAAISQSISGFQAGVTYTLTFSAAQRPCCATSQDFQVYLDNTLLGTFHPSGTSYADYSTTFTTTAGAHVLKFAGLNSNGGDNTAFLDNVRLTGAGASTGETNYVLQDIQGSTRAVMNNNAVSGTSTIIARHDYLPFGEEIGSGTGLRTPTQGYGATDTNRQKYGLLERDDTTGLDHTWFRKYESFSGRMTTPDPYGGSVRIADPQSFNRYSYVQNDPVNFVDPTGLDWEIDWLSCMEVPIIDPETGGFARNRYGGVMTQTICGLSWFGGVGVGPDGRGGPIGAQPQKPKKEKKKCKQDPNRTQDPNGGDIPEIKDYLTKAGLLNTANPSASLIDPASIKPSKEGITYTINDVTQFNSALANNQYAFDLNTGFPWAGQHDDQVGGKGVDNRSRTGTKPDKLGRKSVQVVVGPVIDRQKGTAATGYSDLDCSNPAQSPGSAIKHILGK
jgi:RHS repeat-associated protein